MVLVSKRSLKAGETLCESYNMCTFFGHTKEARQSILLEKNNFICDCIPCLEDWPQSNDVYWKKEVKFCCSVCSSKFGPDERRRENFQKIILNPGNDFKCSSCGLNHSEKELQEKLVQYRTTLDSSPKLFKDGFILETIKSLKEAAQFFQFNLIPPTKDQIRCENLLRNAISYSVVNDDE